MKKKNSRETKQRRIGPTRGTEPFAHYSDQTQYYSTCGVIQSHAVNSQYYCKINDLQTKRYAVMFVWILGKFELFIYAYLDSGYQEDSD